MADAGGGRPGSPLGQLVAGAILGWGVLLLGSCGPKDPYEALKPHQALEAGDEAYRRGQYAEAEKIYQLAVKKAERAELEKFHIQREYVGRLAQIYALQGKVGEVEPLYLQMIEASEQNLVRYRQWLPAGLRAAHNLAVLEYRHGRYADAEGWLTKMGDHWLDHFVKEGLTQPENYWTGDFWRRWVVQRDPDLQFVVLSHLDRVYSALGRREEADIAFRHLVNLLGVLKRLPRETLRPRLLDHLQRYATYLRGASRVDQAAELEEIVRTFQARLPQVGDVAHQEPCITFDADPPAGCLLEIQ